jgi:DNA replication protein DnaC
MLVEQTMEKLVAMKLRGMAEALRRWLEKPKEKQLTPRDLVGLLADAEWEEREQKRLTARLRNARFRQEASVEDIDYQHPRGLAKAVMLDLAACRWVTAHQNVVFTGAHRRWQELPRLCARPEGVPRRAHRRVPADLAATG